MIKWTSHTPTVIALAGILGIIGLYSIHKTLMRFAFDFLSVNKPVDAKVLIIEGWLTDRMLKEAVTEFFQAKYSYCLVSGKPKNARSPVDVLARFGLDTSVIRFTPAETKLGHKTYHIALAAGKWLQQNDPTVVAVNVFTAGPHGRKSWTIMKRVLGKGFSVGVVSSSVIRSDSGLSWESKQGGRNMVKYGIGYLYAMVWPFDKKALIKD